MPQAPPPLGGEGEREEGAELQPVPPQVQAAQGAGAVGRGLEVPARAQGDCYPSAGARGGRHRKPEAAPTR